MSRQRRTISSPHGTMASRWASAAGSRAKAGVSRCAQRSPWGRRPCPARWRCRATDLIAISALQARVRRAMPGPSMAAPALPDCWVAVAEPHARADGSARMRPGALAPSSAPPTVACDPRSCRAEWSGLCRTFEMAARRHRIAPRTARPDNSPPQPSYAPSCELAASAPGSASFGRSAE